MTVIVADFMFDKRKNGFKLLEDVDFTPINPAKLELVPFLKEGEQSIDGETMVRRARQKLHINLGQRHAEYLLKHQKEIPEDFQRYRLVFTGTIWLSPMEFRSAVYLYHHHSWQLNSMYLKISWDSLYRLVRLRK